MDELNLYDDLDDFQEQQEKKSKELQEVEEKYQKALKTIEELREENKTLKKNIQRIELGFQSLLDTARNEIKRKDKEIERLRKENDDICFRRKIPQRSVNAGEKEHLKHNPSIDNPFKSTIKDNERPSAEAATIKNSNDNEKTESYKRARYHDNERDHFKDYKRHRSSREEYNDKYSAKTNQKREDDLKESRSRYREKEKDNTSRQDCNRNRSRERKEYEKPCSSKVHRISSESPDRYGKNYDRSHSRERDKYNKYRPYERNRSRERKNIVESSKMSSRSPTRENVRHADTKRGHDEKNYKTEIEKSQKTLDKDIGNQKSKDLKEREENKKPISSSKTKHLEEGDGNKQQPTNNKNNKPIQQEKTNKDSIDTLKSVTIKNKLDPQQKRNASPIHKTITPKDCETKKDKFHKDCNQESEKTVKYDRNNSNTSNNADLQPKLDNEPKTETLKQTVCETQKDNTHKHSNEEVQKNSEIEKTTEILSQPSSCVPSKLCTPRKVALFNELFGESPSDGATSSTASQSKNSLLNNIKGILAKSTPIAYISSATTSPGDYTDISSVEATSKGDDKIIEIISSANTTPDVNKDINDNQPTPKRSEKKCNEDNDIEKCFVPTKIPDENVKTIACVDLTEIVDDDIANEIEFVQILGLDLCPPTENKEVKNQTKKNLTTKELKGGNNDEVCKEKTEIITSTENLTAGSEILDITELTHNKSDETNSTNDKSLELVENDNCSNNCEITLTAETNVEILSETLTSENSGLNTTKDTSAENELLKINEKNSSSKKIGEMNENSTNLVNLDLPEKESICENLISENNVIDLLENKKKEEATNVFEIASVLSPKLLELQTKLRHISDKESDEIVIIETVNSGTIPPLRNPYNEDNVTKSYSENELSIKNDEHLLENINKATKYSNNKSHRKSETLETSVESNIQDENYCNLKESEEKQTLPEDDNIAKEQVEDKATTSMDSTNSVDESYKSTNTEQDFEAKLTSSYSETPSSYKETSNNCSNNLENNKTLVIEKELAFKSNTEINMDANKNAENCKQSGLLATDEIIPREEQILSSRSSPIDTALVDNCEQSPTVAADEIQSSSSPIDIAGNAKIFEAEIPKNSVDNKQHFSESEANYERNIKQTDKIIPREELVLSSASTPTDIVDNTFETKMSQAEIPEKSVNNKQNFSESIADTDDIIPSENNIKQTNEIIPREEQVLSSASSPIDIVNNTFETKISEAEIIEKSVNDKQNFSESKADTDAVIPSEEQALPLSSSPMDTPYSAKSSKEDISEKSFNDKQNVKESKADDEGNFIEKESMIEVKLDEIETAAKETQTKSIVLAELPGQIVTTVLRNEGQNLTSLKEEEIISSSMMEEQSNLSSAAEANDLKVKQIDKNQNVSKTEFCINENIKNNLDEKQSESIAKEILSNQLVIHNQKENLSPLFVKPAPLPENVSTTKEIIEETETKITTSEISDSNNPDNLKNKDENFTRVKEHVEESFSKDFSKESDNEEKILETCDSTTSEVNSSGEANIAISNKCQETSITTSTIDPNNELCTQNHSNSKVNINNETSCALKGREININKENVREIYPEAKTKVSENETAALESSLEAKAKETDTKTISLAVEEKKYETKDFSNSISKLESCDSSPSKNGEDETAIAIIDLPTNENTSHSRNKKTESDTLDLKISLNTSKDAIESESYVKETSVSKIRNSKLQSNDSPIPETSLPNISDKSLEKQQGDCLIETPNLQSIDSTIPEVDLTNNPTKTTKEQQKGSRIEMSKLQANNSITSEESNIADEVSSSDMLEISPTKELEANGMSNDNVVTNYSTIPEANLINNPQEHLNNDNNDEMKSFVVETMQESSITTFDVTSKEDNKVNKDISSDVTEKSVSNDNVVTKDSPIPETNLSNNPPEEQQEESRAGMPNLQPNNSTISKANVAINPAKSPEEQLNNDNNIEMISTSTETQKLHSNDSTISETNLSNNPVEKQQKESRTVAQNLPLNDSTNPEARLAINPAESPEEQFNNDNNVEIKSTFAVAKYLKDDDVAEEIISPKVIEKSAGKELEDKTISDAVTDDILKIQSKNTNDLQDPCNNDSQLNENNKDIAETEIIDPHQNLIEKPEDTSLQSLTNKEKYLIGSRVSQASLERKMDNDFGKNAQQTENIESVSLTEETILDPQKFGINNEKQLQKYIFEKTNTNTDKTKKITNDSQLLVREHTKETSVESSKSNILQRSEVALENVHETANKQTFIDSNEKISTDTAIEQIDCSEAESQLIEQNIPKLTNQSRSSDNEMQKSADNFENKNKTQINISLKPNESIQVLKLKDIEAKQMETIHEINKENVLIDPINEKKIQNQNEDTVNSNQGITKTSIDLTSSEEKSTCFKDPKEFNKLKETKEQLLKNKDSLESYISTNLAKEITTKSKDKTAIDIKGKQMINTSEINKNLEMMGIESTNKEKVNKKSPVVATNQPPINTKISIDLQSSTKITSITNKPEYVPPPSVLEKFDKGLEMNASSNLTQKTPDNSQQQYENNNECTRNSECNLEKPKEINYTKNKYVNVPSKVKLPVGSKILNSINTISSFRRRKTLAHDQNTVMSCKSKEDCGNNSVNRDPMTSTTAKSLHYLRAQQVAEKETYKQKPLAKEENKAVADQIKVINSNSKNVADNTSKECVSFVAPSPRCMTQTEPTLIIDDRNKLNQYCAITSLPNVLNTDYNNRMETTNFIPKLCTPSYLLKKVVTKEINIEGEIVEVVRLQIPKGTNVMLLNSPQQNVDVINQTTGVSGVSIANQMQSIVTPLEVCQTTGNNMTKQTTGITGVEPTAYKNQAEFTSLKEICQIPKCSNVMLLNKPQQSVDVFNQTTGVSGVVSAANPTQSVLTPLEVCQITGKDMTKQNTGIARLESTAYAKPAEITASKEVFQSQKNYITKQITGVSQLIPSEIYKVSEAESIANKKRDDAKPLDVYQRMEKCIIKQTVGVSTTANKRQDELNPSQVCKVPGDESTAYKKQTELTPLEVSGNQITEVSAVESTSDKKQAKLTPVKVCQASEAELTANKKQAELIPLDVCPSMGKYITKQITGVESTVAKKQVEPTAIEVCKVPAAESTTNKNQAELTSSEICQSKRNIIPTITSTLPETDSTHVVLPTISTNSPTATKQTEELTTLASCQTTRKVLEILPKDVVLQTSQYDSNINSKTVPERNSIPAITSSLPETCSTQVVLHSIATNSSTTNKQDEELNPLAACQSTKKELKELPKEVVEFQTPKKLQSKIFPERNTGPTITSTLTESYSTHVVLPSIQANSSTAIKKDELNSLAACQTTRKEPEELPKEVMEFQTPKKLQSPQNDLNVKSNPVLEKISIPTITSTLPETYSTRVMLPSIPANSPTSNKKDDLNPLAACQITRKQPEELPKEVIEFQTPKKLQTPQNNLNIKSNPVLEKNSIPTNTSNLTETYSTNVMLPSISTNSPTPPNFSGIFSKKPSSSIIPEEDSIKSRKKSPHFKPREYVLPAVSVLCNVDNLENATKVTKKLHWELLENKNEMTEIEDDADIDTTDEEPPLKIKEEPIDNVSSSPKQSSLQSQPTRRKSQKSSPSETDTQTEDESLLRDIRQQAGTYKPSNVIPSKVHKLKHRKHKLPKNVKVRLKAISRSSTDTFENSALMTQMPFSIVFPKRPVGRPRKLPDNVKKNKVLEITKQHKKRGRKPKIKPQDELVGKNIILESKLEKSKELPLETIEDNCQTKSNVLEYLKVRSKDISGEKYKPIQEQTISNSNEKNTDDDDVIDNIENTVKILSTSVERLEISDEPCSSKDSVKQRKSFDKQIEVFKYEDDNSSSMIYHKQDFSTDDINTTVDKNPATECNQNLENRAEKESLREKQIGNDIDSPQIDSLENPQESVKKTQNNCLISTSNSEADILTSDKTDNSSEKFSCIESNKVSSNSDPVAKQQELPSSSGVTQENILSQQSDSETDKISSEEHSQDSRKEKSLKTRRLKKPLMKKKLKSKIKNKVTTFISLEDIGIKVRPLKVHLSTFRIPKIKKDAEEIIDNSWKLETYIELEKEGEKEQDNEKTEDNIESECSSTIQKKNEAEENNDNKNIKDLVINKEDEGHDKQQSSINDLPKETDRLQDKQQSPIKDLSKVSDRLQDEKNKSPTKNLPKETDHQQDKQQFPINDLSKETYRQQDKLQLPINDLSKETDTKQDKKQNSPTKNIYKETEKAKKFIEQIVTDSNEKANQNSLKNNPQSKDQLETPSNYIINFDNKTKTGKRKLFSPDMYDERVIEDNVDTPSDNRNSEMYKEQCQYLSETHELNPVKLRRKSLHLPSKIPESSSSVIKTDIEETESSNNYIKLRRKSINVHRRILDSSSDEDDDNNKEKKKDRQSTNESNTKTKSENLETDLATTSLKEQNLSNVSNKKETKKSLLVRRKSMYVERTPSVLQETKEIEIIKKSMPSRRKSMCVEKLPLLNKDTEKTETSESSKTINDTKLPQEQQGAIDNTKLSQNIVKEQSEPKTIKSFKMRRKSMYVESSTIKMASPEKVKNSDDSSNLLTPSSLQQSSTNIKNQDLKLQTIKDGKQNIESPQLSKTLEEVSQTSKPIASFKMRRKSMYLERHKEEDKNMAIDLNKPKNCSEKPIDKSVNKKLDSQHVKTTSQSSTEQNQTKTIEMRRKSTNQKHDLDSKSEDQNSLNSSESKQKLEKKSEDTKLESIKMRRESRNQREVTDRTTKNERVVETDAKELNKSKSEQKKYSEDPRLNSNKQMDTGSDSSNMLTNQRPIKMRRKSTYQEPITDSNEDDRNPLNSKEVESNSKQQLEEKLKEKKTIIDSKIQTHKAADSSNLMTHQRPIKMRRKSTYQEPIIDSKEDDGNSVNSQEVESKSKQQLEEQLKEKKTIIDSKIEKHKDADSSALMTNRRPIKIRRKSTYQEQIIDSKKDNGNSLKDNKETENKSKQKLEEKQNETKTNIERKLPTELTQQNRIEMRRKSTNQRHMETDNEEQSTNSKQTLEKQREDKKPGSYSSVMLNQETIKLRRKSKNQPQLSGSNINDNEKIKMNELPSNKLIQELKKNDEGDTDSSSSDVISREKSLKTKSKSTNQRLILDAGNEEKKQKLEKNCNVIQTVSSSPVTLPPEKTANIQRKLTNNHGNTDKSIKQDKIGIEINNTKPTIENNSGNTRPDMESKQYLKADSDTYTEQLPQQKAIKIRRKSTYQQNEKPSCTSTNSFNNQETKNNTQESNKSKQKVQQETNLNLDNIPQNEPDSDSSIVLTQQKSIKIRRKSINQLRILDTSSDDDDEPLIKKPTVISNEIKTPLTTATKPRQRRKRVVKVLSTSLESPTNVSNNTAPQSSCPASPLTSPTLNHPIFNTEVSTQSREFAASMPMTPNQQDDNKFKEIDSKLHAIFQSPQYTVDYKISPAVDASNLAILPPPTLNDSTTNVTIDETQDINQENNQSSLNASQINESTSCVNGSPSTHNNSEVKHLSLGSAEYRFEKVSDNVINLFISRKRKRKRNN